MITNRFHSLPKFLRLALLACATALFGAPTVRIAAPTVYAFNVSSSGTINLGERVSLSWSVSDGSSISISPDIGPVTGTEISVSPITTTTYVLTASNASGSVTKSRKITVVVPPAVTALTVTPDTVVPNGATTLAWSGTAAGYYTVTTDAASAQDMLSVGIGAARYAAVLP